jgi:acyl-CoA reductase-like NAD-dependent aldehyde dehydrogenase
VKKSVERAKKITVGDPAKSAQGPLVDKEQFDRVLKLINAGVR